MDINITQGFTEKVCGNCGIIYFIPDVIEDECKKTGKTWYCPNGHPRVYSESEADKYKRLYKEEVTQGLKRNNELTAAENAIQELTDKLEKCAKKKASRKPAKK